MSTDKRISVNLCNQWEVIFSLLRRNPNYLNHFRERPRVLIRAQVVDFSCCSCCLYNSRVGCFIFSHESHGWARIKEFVSICVISGRYIFSLLRRNPNYLNHFRERGRKLIAAQVVGLSCCSCCLYNSRVGCFIFSYATKSNWHPFGCQLSFIGMRNRCLTDRLYSSSLSSI